MVAAASETGMESQSDAVEGSAMEGQEMTRSPVELFGRKKRDF